MNYLDTRLRELGNSQGLLLRQVVTQIDIETALIEKEEHSESIS